MMQKIFLTISLCLLQTMLVAGTRADQIRTDLLNPNCKRVLVASHRADWRNFPENSLEGIESAIQMGVDIVELDLQQTKDGQLILMHDAKLDRTTTGKGKISEWTLDSIKTLYLKNGCNIKTIHKVPTLEEALMLCKGRVLINLDKADRYFDQVYDLLQKTGTARQIIMKGRKPAYEVKELYGQYLDEVIYMPIVQLDAPDGWQRVQDFMTHLQPAAFEMLFVSDTCQVPLLVRDELHGKSLIWYNTLWDTMAGGHDDDMSLKNLDAGYGYLINTLGARILQTDRPERLIKYLQQLKIK